MSASPAEGDVNEEEGSPILRLSWEEVVDDQLIFSCGTSSEVLPTTLDDFRPCSSQINDVVNEIPRSSNPSLPC